MPIKHIGPEGLTRSFERSIANLQRKAPDTLVNLVIPYVLLSATRGPGLDCLDVVVMVKRESVA